MKLYNPNGSPLMEIDSFRREGNNLMISGRITMMGAMPLTCILTPTEARQALKQVGRNWLFVLTLLFRK